MASIRRFEDIDAWQEARQLADAIYSTSYNGRFQKDWGLVDQIRRASVSIMTNIAEGFDSSTNAEFIRFLGYSRRSASEAQSHLYVARDRNYVTPGEFEGLYETTEKVRRMVTPFITCLRRSSQTRQRANAPTGQRANMVTG